MAGQHRREHFESEVSGFFVARSPSRTRSIPVPPQASECDEQVVIVNIGTSRGEIRWDSGIYCGGDH